MKHRSRLVFFIAASVALLAYLFFRLTPFPLQSTVASYQACDEDPGEDKTYVTTSWNPSAYVIALDQVENCGVTLHAASVQRIGSHLFVRTDYRSPSGDYTACYCRHKYKLLVNNLAESSYTVHVYTWP